MNKFHIQGRTLAMIGVLVPLMALFVYVAVRSGPLAPVLVTATTVEDRSIRPALFGIGTVEARYTYRIGPTFAGRVKQVSVDVGAAGAGTQSQFQCPLVGGGRPDYGDIGRSGPNRCQGRARSGSIQDPHEHSECINGKRIVSDPEVTEPQRDDTLRNKKAMEADLHGLGRIPTFPFMRPPLTARGCRQARGSWTGRLRG